MNSLVHAQNRLFNGRMEVNAKSNLIKQFQKQNWQPTTVAEMKREIAEMERKVEINNATKEHLLIRLKEQSNELVRLRIEAQIFQSNNGRVGRAKQRIEHLKNFTNIVSEAVMIAEIIWILMQFDMERMKRRNDFDPKLDKYRIEALTCSRRMVNKTKKTPNFFKRLNVYVIF